MTTAVATVAIRSRAKVEIAYQRFLTQTRLPVLSIATFSLVLIGKMGKSDRAPAALQDAAIFIPAISWIVWIALTVALAFTFGRREIRAVGFGRLNFWLGFFLAIILGFACHYLIDLVIHALGATIGKPERDIFNIVLVMVISPLGEEAWFQLVLQTWLQRWGTIVSVGCTTILFALFHLDQLNRLPDRHDLVHLTGLLPSLLIYALIRRYCGSMLMALVAHVTANGVAFALDPW